MSFRIPQVRVLAISDVDIAAAARIAAECNIPTVTDESTAILDNGDIDAVIICSSTDTHALFIEKAAEAGKHIFCEKPIDIDLTRLDRALSKVEAAGVKLQVGFQRRFDPNFLKVQNLVRDGSLGKPLVLRITSRAPEPPSVEYIKGSGGLFLDMMIHDFDMARFLIGSEVEEVYAVGSARVSSMIGEAGDIDTSVVTLRFENGTMGTLDCCRKSGYGYDQRAEVFGDQGLARVENEQPNRTSVSSIHSIRQELPLFSFLERYRQAYVAEMEGFVGCVLEDDAPRVTGFDGRIAVVIGQAAQKSLKENRPIRIDVG
jgi:myo-inositol 2-dehydrogenase/D-chiro-inositol 1-dehydrogenase